jgi:hypothetical protein
MAKRVYAANEMARLYAKKPGEWLLVQVLERDVNGKAQKLKLLHHAKEKENLREFLLDKEDWTLNSDIVFVYSDPDKICEL